jgi:hypothetical protein
LFARFHPFRVEGTWQGKSLEKALFPALNEEIGTF